MYNRVNITFP